MTTPTSVGGANALGMVTSDYTGSLDEYQDRVIGDLIARYVSGQGGAGWASPSFSSPYGTPDPADFGAGYTQNPTTGAWTPAKPVSFATVKFIEEYVKNEASSSPYIASTYGAPPSNHATFVQDPNSPAAIQGSFAQRAALDRELSAADNAAANYRAELDAAVSREGIASAAATAAMQEQGATQRTQMQIDASWREAALADATRRYIAEGDWGTQRWITEQQEAGALTRLQLQLQFNREALAQDAIAEANRHQENLVSLALQIAQYDAELAGDPANLYAYAAWLQNRNVVVNGMTLAMAQQEVPLEAIDPGEVANTTGDNIAGIQQQQALVSGASGGSQQATSPEELQKIIAGTTGAPAGTTAQRMAGGALPQHQPSPSAEQIGATDPAALATTLLGMNPVAPTAVDTSQQNLQAIANSLNVGGGAKTAAGFGSWGGPTTNALGVTPPQISGQDVDFRKFANLLDTEQKGVLAGVKSIRGSAGMTDFTRELERSRPKGRLSGAATWG